SPRALPPVPLHRLQRQGEAGPRLGSEEDDAGGAPRDRQGAARPRPGDRLRRAVEGRPLRRLPVPGVSPAEVARDRAPARARAAPGPARGGLLSAVRAVRPEEPAYPADFTPSLVPKRRESELVHTLLGEA